MVEATHWTFKSGRGDRAVEGARLEIVCTPNKGTGGSNPPLSAILNLLRSNSVGAANPLSWSRASLVTHQELKVTSHFACCHTVRLALCRTRTLQQPQGEASS